MHGLGNDFILVNALVEQLPADLAGLALRLCHRNLGIGADGLILVLPSKAADISMRIFNSDGSEPEMCGNGIRCFAKYIFDRKIVQKKQIKVETLAGIIVPEVVVEGGAVSNVRVDMGEPVLTPDRIPFVDEGVGPVVGKLLQAGGETFPITPVSMGNPHCVIFVPDAEKVPLSVWGPPVETHSSFPRKANVEFVQVLGPEDLKMRVWERGAGITMACGTGACAAGVAGYLNGKTGRRVKVHLAAGALDILWSDSDNHVYMTGPAVEVYHGEGCA